MSPENRSRLLHYLVRFHFAYLISIPLLGLIGWWFVWRSSLMVMIIAGFAAIAAFYSLQIERYHLTAHLPSAMWVVLSGPLLLVAASWFAGGLWFFFVDATFVEIGGMCAGIVAGATVRGLEDREYRMPAILYFFMGGFVVVWGWGMVQTHAGFHWYDNVWLIVAFANAAYGYSRMFVSGEIELRYGNTRAAARAGTGWLNGPLNDHKGFVLIVVFAVLIVLSPFVLGALNYFVKL
ncbi:MAG TPA: hypothetical protein VE961_06340 [Pyrinomonadaceae bacterium]|nr:hypothetical protein [Pyrinomonadaceae bacterium]